MREIPLNKGKVALVSDEDFERVSKFKWTFHACTFKKDEGYAVRNATVAKNKREWIRMHRFILDLPPGSLSPDLVVDHKDGNGLNNQRENLEVVTTEENQRRAIVKRKKNMEMKRREEPFL